MLVVLTILITIACILLTLVVLIQNPKGGGLGATFGAFSNQMMGVQRTTDILEKATWALAIILIGFSLITKFFIDTPTTLQETAPQQQQQTTPTQPPLQEQPNEVPFPTQPAE